MNANRRGFTLVELLVVIGIIGLLVAILVPMTLKASRQARKTRAKADLQVISVALEAYKSDFGDYPRIDYTANPITTGQGAGAVNNTGAFLLGKALLGPANNMATVPAIPAIDMNAEYKPGDYCSSGAMTYCNIHGSRGVSVGVSNQWTPFWAYDGADGPGFKARQGAGKTYGPYVDPAKVTHQGMALTDPDGGVILYFAARKPRPNVTIDNGTGSIATEPYLSMESGTDRSAYNANDNLEFFRRIVPAVETDQVAVRRMRMVMGDFDANGYQSNDDALSSLPFVLITPGIDGFYGPLDLAIPTGTISAADAKQIRDVVAKSDDVTNLDAGQ